MRARAAYIRSLGTTSILVAAALLMLGVVGALVGYHGWPEGAVGRIVPSVPLAPTPQPVLSAVRDVRKATPGRAAPAHARTASTASTAGLVKVVPVSSPEPVGYPVAVAPGHAVPTAGAPAPTGATPAPHDPTPANPVNPSPPPTPPADTTALQTLLAQILGSAPPPPGASAQPGDASAVTIPIVGVTVSAPSERAR